MFPTDKNSLNPVTPVFISDVLKQTDFVNQVPGKDNKTFIQGTLAVGR